MMGPWCVIRKMFPYMNLRIGHVRPHRIRRHALLLVKGLPSVCEGDVPISFVVGPSLRSSIS